jgi:hypothetical protein
MATDDASYKWFHELGYPTYQVVSDPSERKAETAVAYGTVEYQKLILMRTKLVNMILRLGYNILLCDVDAVWLADPHPCVRPSVQMSA